MMNGTVDTQLTWTWAWPPSTPPCPYCTHRCTFAAAATTTKCHSIWSLYGRHCCSAETAATWWHQTDY